MKEIERRFDYAPSDCAGEAAPFPSPLVGEGGRDAKASRTGEGSVSADRDPSSGTDFVRATFSHKGRREEEHLYPPSIAAIIQRLISDRRLFCPSAV